MYLLLYWWKITDLESSFELALITSADGGRTLLPHGVALASNEDCSCSICFGNSKVLVDDGVVLITGLVVAAMGGKWRVWFHSTGSITGVFDGSDSSCNGSLAIADGHNARNCIYCTCSEISVCLLFSPNHLLYFIIIFGVLDGSVKHVELASLPPPSRGPSSSLVSAVYNPNSCQSASGQIPCLLTSGRGLRGLLSYCNKMTS